MSRTSSSYDAFMSYGHGIDGTVAPLFQRELERFGKPWYRIRALRVFRDNANLSATPALWQSIEYALSESRWFVLLASPAAARSEWVDKEVAWWLKHRSADKLLVVLTGGDLNWDAQSDTIDRATTTALPPSLIDSLRQEPRWVDLRWLRTKTDVAGTDTRMLDNVADVASAITEKPKDDVVGEHVRQHRRTKRTVRGAITVLALLLIASAISTVVAVDRGNAAVEQARIATARQMAAIALSLRHSRLDLAMLIAVEAYRMDPSPQAKDALFQTVTSSPRLSRFRHIGKQATALAGTGSERAVVSGASDGTLMVWDIETDTIREADTGLREIEAIAADDNADTVVASDGTAVGVWRGDVTSLPMIVHRGAVTSVGVSPSGRTIAVLDNWRKLMLFNSSSGALLRETETAGMNVAFADEQTLMVGGGTGSWERRSASTLAVIDSLEQIVTPGSLFYCCGFSRSGRWMAWAKYSTGNAVPQFAIQDETQRFGSIREITIDQPEKIAVNDDGTQLAATAGDRLYLSESEHLTTRRPVEEELPGTGRVDAMTFLGTNRMVSASADNLVLWDFTMPSRLAIDDPTPAPDASNAGPPPRIAISPDGKNIAVAAAEWGNVHITRGTQPIFEVPADRQSIPLWRSDGTALYLVTKPIPDEPAEPDALVWQGGGTKMAWPPSDNGIALAAGVSPDDATIVVVTSTGTLVRAIEDGRVVATIPGPITEPDAKYTGWVSAAVRGDTAMTAVIDVDGRVWITDVVARTSRALGTGSAESVTFSGANLVVAKTDSSVEVWDIARAEILRTVPADATYVDSMAALPDQDLLVRIDSQGALAVMDLRRGVRIGSLPLPYPDRSTGLAPWSATAVAASPAGQDVVTATVTGSTTRWRLTPEHWIQVACRTAAHDLSQTDWEAYLTAPYPGKGSCYS
jgi:WD40 repeat protein